MNEDGFRNPAINRVEGDPGYMIMAKDQGDSCAINVPLPTTEEGTEKLVEAAAKVVLAVAVVLKNSPHKCGHIGCIFNEIASEAVTLLRESFPDEYKRARDAAKLQAIMKEYPSGNDSFH